MKRLTPLIFGASFCFLFAYAAPADAQVLRNLSPEKWRPGEVSVWKSDFTERDRFRAFDAAHKFGGNLASYDLDKDGEPELIVGAGEGSAPYVKVFSLNGELKKSFLAYEKEFLGGVRVAAGDTDRDGNAEIITSPGPGRAPTVRRFDRDGNFKSPNGFDAYHPAFQGGVHLAVGDVNGDGADEIVTTPGAGGGPHVRIFNGSFESLGDLFAFDAGMRDGITPAIIRVPGGTEIAISVESWERPAVRRYVLRDGIMHLVREFLAFDENWKHGVTIEAVDIDGDGLDEIAAHGNGESVPELRILSREGAIIAKYMIHDPIYRGGLSVAQIPGQKKIASISKTPLVVGPLDTEKAIHVNISEQRLYAFEHGRLANTFLISSGTYKYPTPIVESKVLAKIPIMDYRWSYGPNHPENYNLPNVRWNLRFWPHYYLHSAYWHNNFGNRMSHGCVNISISNAEWLFNWADVGTPVKTFYAT